MSFAKKMPFAVCFVTLIAILTVFLPLTVSANDPIVLKMGHIGPATDTSYFHRSMLHFADLFANKTNGAARIDVYPASQLGSANKMIKGIPAGLVDIVEESIGRLSMWEPGFRLLDLPYFVDSAAQNIRILESPVGRELVDKVTKKTGIFLVPGYYHTRAPRQMFTTKKPVFTPEDVKGLKMRVKKLKQFTYYWERLGANPISVNYAELYMALSQGVVDACEGLISNISGMKIYEPAKYATLINYTHEVHVLFMSEKKFNNLPSAIQKALTEAAREGAAYADEAGKREDLRAREIVKKGGMAIIDVDTAPFKKKAEGLAQQLEAEGEWEKGLYAKMSKIK